VNTGAQESAGADFASYFGNGTSAIYAALRAFGCRDQWVALPANICPSVIAAIRESSNRPLFVDIERTSCGLAPEALATVIGELGAVIAVHAFGIPCRIAELSLLCSVHGVPLIEDCAQAEGARINGVPVGGSGDVAVFSYGAGKILDLGGGGASLTRDAALLEKLEAEHRLLPVFTGEAASAGLGKLLKDYYNGNYPDDLDRIRDPFTDYLEEHGHALLRGVDERQLARIEQGRQALQENIRARHAKCARYEALLKAAPQLEILRFPPQAAPWRFNLLVEPALRNWLLRSLLREGRRVSSWYTDLSAFMRADSWRGTDLTNSRWLSDRILNFWVDESTADADIVETCARLLALAEKS
jgi:dTDP-4-amino-4,6-dideoxygalactose transaminase